MSRVDKVERRARRAKGIRKKISGDSVRPRLTVTRSLNHIYAQIIDDSSMRTIVSASTNDKGFDASGSKMEQAKKVGVEIGKKAVSAKITIVAFDRNGFLYHGRVKALAEGMREAGLQF